MHSNQLGFWLGFGVGNISFPVFAFLAVSNEHLIIVQGLGVSSQHLLVGCMHINQQLRLGFWCWQHLLSGSCFACGEQGTPHHRSRLAVSQSTSPFGVLCIAANSCNISFSVFAFLTSSKEHLIIVQGLGFPSQHLLLGFYA